MRDLNPQYTNYKTLRVDLLGAEAELGNRFMRVEKDIIIADLHLGKASHFRKFGYAIPAVARENDFIRLENLLLRFEPQRLIFLGDLFHSEYNEEWDRFITLRAKFDSCEFVLIEGNHDILDPQHYADAQLKVVKELSIGNLWLTHEPISDGVEGFLNVHGHVHPGIHLKGKARQTMKIACFHVSAKHVCVPAFGSLTGLAIRKPKSGDRIFATMDEGVFDLSQV